MKDKLIMLVPIVLWAAILFGYGRCVYKLASCNWEPIGKAEIVYTVGTFTGAGVVIGYLNIKDK
jgi:hypothetical protein